MWRGRRSIPTLTNDGATPSTTITTLSRVVGSKVWLGIGRWGGVKRRQFLASFLHVYSFGDGLYGALGHSDDLNNHSDGTGGDGGSRNAANINDSAWSRRGVSKNGCGSDSLFLSEPVAVSALAHVQVSSVAAGWAQSAAIAATSSPSDDDVVTSPTFNAVARANRADVTTTLATGGDGDDEGGGGGGGGGGGEGGNGGSLYVWGHPFELRNVLRLRRTVSFVRGRIEATNYLKNKLVWISRRGC